MITAGLGTTSSESGATQKLFSVIQRARISDATRDLSWTARLSITIFVDRRIFDYFCRSIEILPYDYRRGTVAPPGGSAPLLLNCVRQLGGRSQHSGCLRQRQVVRPRDHHLAPAGGMRPVEGVLRRSRAWWAGRPNIAREYNLPSGSSAGRRRT
eukprot:478469-Prorocentrum_minimum.AAC.1